MKLVRREYLNGREHLLIEVEHEVRRYRVIRFEQPITRNPYVWGEEPAPVKKKVQDPRADFVNRYLDVLDGVRENGKTIEQALEAE